MILLLDNYDSFTYNLAQFLGQLGGKLEVHRNDQITLDEIAAKKPERIVISPGPGTPEDSGICVEVIRRFAGQIPILGVCLGHQAIGYAFGGKVIRAPESLRRNRFRPIWKSPRRQAASSWACATGPCAWRACNSILNPCSPKWG
jgi:anthranilate synthase/aminodeoxychorismate synthase-like glutamine amidotransferase